MRRHQRKVFYDADELAIFVPIWNEISKDTVFKTRIEETRDVLLLADEVGLMDGTSPLLPQLEKVRADFRARARSIDPNLSDSTVRDLYFYCLYHEDGSLEYDMANATAKAMEKERS